MNATKFDAAKKFASNYADQHGLADKIVQKNAKTADGRETIIWECELNMHRIMHEMRHARGLLNQKSDPLDLAIERFGFTAGIIGKMFGAGFFLNNAQFLITDEQRNLLKETIDDGEQVH